MASRVVPLLLLTFLPVPVAAGEKQEDERKLPLFLRGSQSPEEQGDQKEQKKQETEEQGNQTGNHTEQKEPILNVTEKKQRIRPFTLDDPHPNFTDVINGTIKHNPPPPDWVPKPYHISKPSPKDTEAYVEEKMFICNTPIACPQLIWRWGEIVAQDPFSGESMAFGDVMAGPGWVKGWNWGHHHYSHDFGLKNPTEHLTHKHGLSSLEFAELSHELKKNSMPRDDSIEHLLIAAGSKSGTGEMKRITPGAQRTIEALWGWKMKPTIGHTRDIIEQFNEAMNEGIKVGLIAHTTC